MEASQASSQGRLEGFQVASQGSFSSNYPKAVSLDGEEASQATIQGRLGGFLATSQPQWRCLGSLETKQHRPTRDSINRETWGSVPHSLQHQLYQLFSCSIQVFSFKVQTLVFVPVWVINSLLSSPSLLHWGIPSFLSWFRPRLLFGLVCWGIPSVLILVSSKSCCPQQLSICNKSNVAPFLLVCDEL